MKKRRFITALGCMTIIPSTFFKAWDTVRKRKSKHNVAIWGDNLENSAAVQECAVYFKDIEMNDFSQQDIKDMLKIYDRIQRRKNKEV